MKLDNIGVITANVVAAAAFVVAALSFYFQYVKQSDLIAVSGQRLETAVDAGVVGMDLGDGYTADSLSLVVHLGVVNQGTVGVSLGRFGLGMARFRAGYDDGARDSVGPIHQAHRGWGTDTLLGPWICYRYDRVESSASPFRDVVINPGEMMSLDLVCHPKELQQAEMEVLSTSCCETVDRFGQPTTVPEKWTAVLFARTNSPLGGAKTARVAYASTFVSNARVASLSIDDKWKLVR